MQEDPNIRSPDLNALRMGEEGAWAEAFGLLWPLALHAAQHPELFLSREEAQDSASEALVQLISRVDTIRTFEELRALTVVIAYRRAISLARRKWAAKRQPNHSQGGPAAEFGDSVSQVTDPLEVRLTEYELRELVTSLQKALDGLDAETRILLHEKIGHGWSYEELSKKYHMPVGTICAKVARGLRKVRDALAESPELANELKAFLR